MTVISAKVISGAVGFPFWERYGFHFGSTTFWEIIPELILLRPHTKSCQQNFLYKRWLWLIPSHEPSTFCIFLMARWFWRVLAFGGSSPCFVSLGCSLQHCGGQNPQKSAIEPRVMNPYESTCASGPIFVLVYIGGAAMRNMDVWAKRPCSLAQLFVENVLEAHDVSTAVKLVIHM